MRLRAYAIFLSLAHASSLFGQTGPAAPAPAGGQVANGGRKVIAVAILDQSGAYPQFDDEWTATSGSSFVKVNSWISFVSISVLEGQSFNPVRLNRSQTNSSAPVGRTPKPRPRLGGAIPDDQGAAQKPIMSHIEDASRFLEDLVNQFTTEWNAPRRASEATQWVHEIEAECVLVVNKQTGKISIESLANSLNSEIMESFRSNVSGTGTDSGQVKAFISEPVEMVRFENFLLALAPLKAPASLATLPGDTLRIQITFRVAKFGKEAGANIPATGRVAVADATGFSAPGTFDGRSVPKTLVQGNSGRAFDMENPVDQYAVGFRNYQGDGMKKDLILAAYWFQKAADQGYAPAQSQLGFMHQFGQGVARDPAKALFWYGKASDQDYEHAIYNIACMYQNGDGVARDTTEATRWFRKAAELGSISGQITLGSRYASGEGVSKDLVEAQKWYRKAAEQGSYFAQYKMGEIYEKGAGVPRDEVEALAWYYLAPTSGLADETNHRDRLEKLLDPQVAMKAKRRADELREMIQKLRTTPGGRAARLQQTG